MTSRKPVVGYTVYARAEMTTFGSIQDRCDRFDALMRKKAADDPRNSIAFTMLQHEFGKILTNEVLIIGEMHSTSHYTVKGAFAMALQQAVLAAGGRINGWAPKDSATWVLDITEIGAERIIDPIELILGP